MTHPVATPARVLLILGSVRAQRICPAVADCVAQLMQDGYPHLALRIADLAHWPLPLDDEPSMPALNRYASAHTRAWSEEVQAADACIFVTPQYNWGYPAALKNAIDHLYREWHDKPALIITYGGHGGGKCAAQLAQVLAAVKMRVVATMPGIVLHETVIRAGAAFDAERDFAPHAASVAQALDVLHAMLDAGPR